VDPLSASYKFPLSISRIYKVLHPGLGLVINLFLQTRVLAVKYKSIVGWVYYSTFKNQPHIELTDVDGMITQDTIPMSNQANLQEGTVIVEVSVFLAVGDPSHLKPDIGPRTDRGRPR
jgi:hypothetical protein